MSHPFDWKLDTLKTLDLDFEELLSEDETSQVNGGITIGGCYTPYPQPPTPTTAALGEEGGCFPHYPVTRPGFEAGGPYTTLALGEEGGGFPLPL